MGIEKIVVVIADEEYPVSVERIRDADEKMVYLATPDEGMPLLDEVSPGYVEFDEKGNVDIDDRLLNRRVKEITDAMWKAIKAQLRG